MDDCPTKDPPPDVAAADFKFIGSRLEQEKKDIIVIPNVAACTKCCGGG
jgi:hypothetical protein